MCIAHFNSESTLGSGNEVSYDHDSLHEALPEVRALVCVLS